MVEADEGDLDSDEDGQASLEHNTNTDEEEEDDPNEEKKSGSGNSHPSDADSAFMDDVFNQLGGFEVGDYGDEEDDSAEVIAQPTQKKSKSTL
jgi:hypothetical protein